MYAVGLFLKRDFINEIGCFDEKYKMMEDYPFAIKVTSLGYKLNLLDEFVVKYRMRSEIAERSKFFNTKRNKDHITDLSRFQNKEIIPRLKLEKMYIEIYNLYIDRFARNINNINDSILFLYISKIVGYLSLDKIKLKIRMIKMSKKLNKT